MTQRRTTDIFGGPTVYARPLRHTHRTQLVPMQSPEVQVHTEETKDRATITIKRGTYAHSVHTNVIEVLEKAEDERRTSPLPCHSVAGRHLPVS